MRIAIGAIFFEFIAIVFKRPSSASDSTLIHPTPIWRARFNSSMVLPTPEKIIFSGLPPALKTRSSSPPETMSKPELYLAKMFNTARLLLAFTA